MGAFWTWGVWRVDEDRWRKRKEMREKKII